MHRRKALYGRLVLVLRLGGMQHAACNGRQMREGHSVDQASANEVISRSNLLPPYPVDVNQSSIPSGDGGGSCDDSEDDHQSDRRWPRLAAGANSQGQSWLFGASHVMSGISGVVFSNIVTSAEGEGVKGSTERRRFCPCCWLRESQDSIECDVGHYASPAFPRDVESLMKSQEW